jgi:hypothetical protein
MVRGILLTANLPQLQNLIKRDPASYKEEFLQQWNHYNSIRQIFQINPDEQAQHFRELVTFISQVWIRRGLNVALGAERLAGRTVLSQGDGRVSCASSVAPPRELWHTIPGYEEDSCAESCHAPKQGCHYVYCVSQS